MYFLVLSIVRPLLLKEEVVVAQNYTFWTEII